MGSQSEQTKHYPSHRARSCKFVLPIVEDTCTRRLKNAKAFYSRVAPLALLELLANHSGGLERADIISLILRLPYFWTRNTHILEYINAIEEAQKKLLQAGCPFSNYLITAFVTHSLLTDNSFPKDLPEWDGKLDVEQTWYKWTACFGPLHIALKCETKASTGQGDTFETAAVASAIHSITPPSFSDAATGKSCGGPDITIIEQFNGCFESLVSATTKRNSVLKRLTATTTTHYTEITKILGAIVANSANDNIAVAATGTPCNTSTTTPALPCE